MTMTRGEAAPPPKSTVTPTSFRDVVTRTIEGMSNKSTVLPSSQPSTSYRDAVRGSSHPVDSKAAALTVKRLISDGPLTEAQVTSLQKQFPRRVVVSKDRFSASASAWKNALLGKCLGHEPSVESLTTSLSVQWSDVGEWEVFPMANGFFAFRFSTPEVRDLILYGGPWVVDGAVLALSLFDPAFRPSAHQVLRAVIWVRLPDLPPAFWSEDLISDILSEVGRVVHLDDHTRLRTKGRFARAAVELDLRHPLLPGITVGVEDDVVPSYWQPFQYEHIHDFCSSCRRVGHKASQCLHSQGVASDHPQAVDTNLSDSPSGSPTDERLPLGWAASLMVRRRGRRADGGGSRDREDDHQRRLHPVRSARFSKAHPHPQMPTPKREGLEESSIGLTDPAPIFSPHPENSSGPHLHGLASGPAGPLSFTSATRPKHQEHSCSSPSLLVGDGSSGNAADGVSGDETRLIQEIMMEDSAVESDTDFTFTGKKKKKSKVSSKEICLRLEPRTRVPMKKVKLGGGFSLLSDLLGDVPPDVLDARYGPDKGNV